MGENVVIGVESSRIHLREFGRHPVEGDYRSTGRCLVDRFDSPEVPSQSRRVFELDPITGIEGAGQVK